MPQKTTPYGFIFFARGATSTAVSRGLCTRCPLSSDSHSLLLPVIAFVCLIIAYCILFVKGFIETVST